MAETLAVSEVFGPTFQGEGVHLGRPCVFVRLAGCNLACSWCDTPYTWDWAHYDKTAEVHVMPITQVVDEVVLHSNDVVRHLVISGGEPMLQQRGVATLVEAIREKRLGMYHWTTEIETAGTVQPSSAKLVDHFTVSPKLSTSDNPLRRRYHPDVLDWFSTAVPSRCFKFVVTSLDDFDEIDTIVQRHALSPVYIMPEGIDGPTVTKRLQAIAAEAVARNYSLTTRLQVLLHGNRRAV